MYEKATDPDAPPPEDSYFFQRLWVHRPCTGFKFTGGGRVSFPEAVIRNNAGTVVKEQEMQTAQMYASLYPTSQPPKKKQADRLRIIN